MDCEHLETEEVRTLPGVIMCCACGALFDAFAEENVPELTTPLTARELDIIIAGLVAGKSYAA